MTTNSRSNLDMWIGLAVLASLVPLFAFIVLVWAIGSSIGCNPDNYAMRNGVAPGSPLLDGCVVSTRDLPILVIAMPQQMWWLAIPGAVLASLAIPPWIIVARISRSDHARGRGRWGGPVRRAVLISAVVAAVAVALWSTQYQVAAHQCRSGTYTKPGSPGRVTSLGCRVPTQGRWMTVPTAGQFRFLQLSTLIAATLAIPPWLLVRSQRHPRSRRKRASTAAGTR